MRARCCMVWTVLPAFPGLSTLAGCWLSRFKKYERPRINHKTLQAEVFHGLQPRLPPFRHPLCCLLFLLQLTSHAGSLALKLEAEGNLKPTWPTPDKTHTVELGGGVQLDMVWCPAGTYACGRPGCRGGPYDDERHIQVVLTKGFWLGKYEVTQAQWEAVMGTTPSYFKNVGKNAPVENVSWNDCQEFIRKLNDIIPGGGFRLPTEMEWEYACRAGTTNAFHYGNDLDATMANFDGNFPYGNGRREACRRQTMPVGSFQPNAWGLYDMHGNVWEWCSDWYGYPIGRSIIDYTGHNSGSARVDRGGSWYSGARGCRSANRDKNPPDFRSSSLGLRLARPHYPVQGAGERTLGDEGKTVP